MLTELGIRTINDGDENPKESSDFWLCTNYTSVVKVLYSGMRKPAVSGGRHVS
jgi:hypothetical protein